MDWQDISILSRAYNKREHIRRLPKFSCDHQRLYERALILGSLGLLVEETGVPGENHRPVTSH
jgi:hypothetical protein